MLHLDWRAEEDTQAFAARLAAHPAIGNAFIELHGDLGAGKTTFARHLLRALGVQGRITSPSFSVVEAYQVAWPQHLTKKTASDASTTLNAAPASELSNKLCIWHFDFYRFNDPREWEDAGLRDLFASTGLKLAEWPAQAGSVLPPADLMIQIDLQADGETRTVTAKAASPTGMELIA